MLRRGLAAVVMALVVGGFVLAEETRGFITKYEDGKITVVTGGGFGQKSEEKTFKVSKEVKITRTFRDKDKEPAKLTSDELKAALKVTGVQATIVHDGDDATEIKCGGGGGRPGKDKAKDKRKDKDKE